MMTPVWLRALALAAFVAGVGGLLHRWGVGLPLLVALACVVAVIALLAPWFGVRLLDSALLHGRAWHWRREEGHHHAFAGVGLAIEDDGRALWVHADDLQQVLRTHEPEDVLAARHSGRWRRNAQGLLLIRVDAVVAQLAAAPSRMEPRTLRFRHYLERQVLFPAEQRRRRSSSVPR